MKGVQLLLGFALLILASSLASAYDPSPLQDICIAIDEPKNAGIHICSISVSKLSFNFVCWRGYILLYNHFRA